MVDKSFGDAGARVVLEELLTGPEVSFFVVANGEHYVPLLSAQDHKRIFDDDQGPNTGGMGAFSPSPLMNDGAAVADRARRSCSRCCRGMAAEGNPFRGFLYCGLMLTPDGPKVIEFNVRFGDPEAQVVLPLLGRSRCPMLRSEGDWQAGRSSPQARISETSTSPSASSSPLTAIPAKFAPATSSTASTTSLAIVRTCSCSSPA